MQQYIQQHKDRFLSELLELLRIPSVSADSKYKADVRLAAEFICEKIKSAGADLAEINETAGHPIVYGEKIINKSEIKKLNSDEIDLAKEDRLHLKNGAIIIL